MPAMTLPEVVLLAVVLALDAFSVGAVVGLTACAPRQVFRLSFHFGLFQALMPLLGAFLGQVLERWIGAFDHWVAFGLLTAIGLKMVFESLRPTSAECQPGDPTRGLRLIGLSLAVSIDALGAGVSLALTMAASDLFAAVAIIGLVASLGTWLGMRLGQAIVERVGRRIETVGGLVLIGLGARMLIA